jgi:hypothetical protein
MVQMDGPGIIENNLSARNVFAARDRSVTYDLIYSPTERRGLLGRVRVRRAPVCRAPFSRDARPVKISISAEHSIAIAMRLASRSAVYHSQVSPDRSARGGRETNGSHAKRVRLVRERRNAAQRGKSEAESSRRGGTIPTPASRR